MDALRSCRRSAAFRAGAILLALGLAACDALPTAPRIEGISLQAAPAPSRDALHLINEFRHDVGCPRLEWHGEAAAVGFLYARRMSDEGFFGHVDPRGGTLRNRLDAAGIAGYRRAGETIAAGQTTGAAVVHAWIASADHREILEDCRYSHVGIGVFTGQGRYPVYWTAVFLATR